MAGRWTDAFQDLVVDKTFPQIGGKIFALNGRRLEQGAAHPGRILRAMEEVKGPGEKVAE
jgi:hypothetical protein